MSLNGYTPTELAILRLLSDGQAHALGELHKCLPDELSAQSAVYRHVSSIRKRLRPSGQTIVCEIANRKCYYRHIVLLGNVSDGSD